MSRSLHPALTRDHPAQVRLKEHGSELVEVSDNGNGVPPTAYAALTAKYHTSKARRAAARVHRRRAC